MTINNINLLGSVPPPLGTPQQIMRSDTASSASWTILGPSASVLSSSDQALITAATGAQFQMTPQGLQMTQAYQSGVPISAQDYSVSLAQVQQYLAKHGETAVPAVTSGLALAGAEFGYVQNFTDAIISIRQEIGQNQSITPSMIVAAAKQSNAINITIPQDYVANATGYLNGLG
jgi:hypothetical protein